MNFYRFDIQPLFNRFTSNRFRVTGPNGHVKETTVQGTQCPLLAEGQRSGMAGKQKWSAVRTPRLKA